MTSASRRWLAPALVVLGAIASIADILISVNRQPTALEQALLHTISLGLSFWGAYVLGRYSARDAAREMMQPHARSAFRRILALYSGLGRLAGRTAELEAAEVGQNAVGYTEILAMANEQLATANDALEDWRDIVPEDVAELEARARAGRGPSNA